MQNSLIAYLGAQPTLMIIKGLLQSSRPRHIRDIASQYSLSPAGASDILRRLNELGILKETSSGNRRCFSIIVSPYLTHTYIQKMESKMLAIYVISLLILLAYTC